MDSSKAKRRALQLAGKQRWPGTAPKDSKNHEGGFSQKFKGVAQLFYEDSQPRRSMARRCPPSGAAWCALPRES
jgi:hypothetical protein